MAGYRTVLFDLDGTLLDTLADLRDAVNHELEREGDPPRTLEEVRTFVGNGLRMLMARALPAGRSEEEIDRRTASMRAYYAANTCHHTAPYPGILALLAALRRRGTAVAVVSNKADEAVQTLCGAFFPGLVDAAVGERPGVPRKPAPDSVTLTLSLLGRDRTGAVYVGDSEVDIATAAAAGLPCVPVSGGLRPRADLVSAGAPRMAGEPAALLALLEAGEDRDG